MKEAIKNISEWSIATQEKAIHMTSEVPSLSCKIDHVCGSIAPRRDTQKF
ncbi:hypothetical protein HMPREF3213_00590 [Heyndrickxia coagulans]|uniref:Uncharacterized protein n=1 Tax=Heyndrickxia coagulans TaxID=1398 RepID=A0A133L087_HEYCO|nr:hypothetical protein HMPREF3213_00590 [Heyndrickxia coagulans]